MEGMQVYVTYHDSNLGATPSNPTGDGSTGGWHVLSTANSRWFSTKSALNINGGTWSDPVRVAGFISIIPVHSSDCVGHWKLNDNAANTLVVDSSGRSHHGTASADTDTFNDTGKVNGCLDMGGTKSVTVPDHDDFTFGDASDDSPFSVAACIYVEASADYQIIIAKYDRTTGSEKREWYFSLSPEEKLRIGLIDESNGEHAISMTDDALTAGWHFVKATYDGTGGATAADGITFYVDGVEVASTAVNSASYVAMENTNVDVTIGMRTGTGGTAEFLFANKIDNVMVINKVLSQGEVNYLYNNGDGTEDLIKEPTDGAGISADVPLLAGIEFIGNTGSGKVGWTGGTIDYAGTKYNIVGQAVGDGSTDEFIYWDADDGNTSFKTTATLATAIGAGNWVVCINAGGVATPANVHKVILGGLIQAATITATQIAADTITANEVVAGTITYTELKQTGGSEAVDTGAMRDDASRVYEDASVAGPISLPKNGDTEVINIDGVVTGGNTVILRVTMNIFNDDNSLKQSFPIKFYRDSTLIATRYTHTIAVNSTETVTVECIHTPSSGTYNFDVDVTGQTNTDGDTASSIDFVVEVIKGK